MINKNTGWGMLEAIRAHLHLPTLGKIFVVFGSASDANYQKVAELFGPDWEGYVRVFAGSNALASAYAAMVTNRNDVCLLEGQTTHTVTAMLTTAKSRCHFLGMDGGGRMMAQGAKVSMGTTGVATDLAPVLNTGVRNSFRNIKFINGSTTNEALYGFIDNGEGTLIEDCSAVKTAGLDDANHAHFWLASDSSTIRNLTVGQSNTPNTAAGFGILIDGKTGGGTDGTVKENYLENVYINMSVGGSVQATSCFIKVADGSALNFGNVIKDLVANNFIPSGGTIMTDAVLGAASTAGNLCLVRPSFFGCTGVGSASGQSIYIANSTAPDANGGLATELTD